MELNRVGRLTLVAIIVGAVAAGPTPAGAAPIAPCASGPGLEAASCDTASPSFEGSNLLVTVTLYDPDADGPFYEFSPEVPGTDPSGTWNEVDGALVHSFSLRGASLFALFHGVPLPEDPSALFSPLMISAAPTESAPEPAVLALFGVVLAYAGRRLRRSLG